MPVDAKIADETWERYCYVRDYGHLAYVKKADVCDAYVRGKQWNPEDEARLAAVRRPAITINKVLPTVLNVLGEQIFNRAEISFQPRNGAPDEVASALTKVFKQISDNNQLDWLRSDAFADGIITSRGYLDVRMDYTDSLTGEVRITNPNPKNVLVDPDGEDYDPDTWGDVTTTKWQSADDIAVLYGRQDADILRNRDASGAQYGVDAIDTHRDRFGLDSQPSFANTHDMSPVLRNIRVIDRQHRKLSRQEHFVDLATGDLRPIPEGMDRNRIAAFIQVNGLGVTTRLVRRIRWTVVAGDVVLHDDWSPYKHFTIVPYFPFFRRGHTVGSVENLLGPQEVLNKTTSQELHVINTTANSGYKVRSGSLANMTPEELEAKGAQTGIVIEVNGDPDKDVQKIQPNQVPQGLDRISYKAEEAIKSISGINDSMAGFDREDVAAKAIEKKKQSGATGLAKPMDSLTRTDWILARNVLDLVQAFYTEERLVTITADTATGETETIAVNQVTPEGRIANDLTLGEYRVVVTSVPHRETLEDSEFEQALSLRELGVTIPDETLIQTSRLRNKSELIKRVAGDAQSPQAQAAQLLQQRGQEAEVSKLEAGAAREYADAQLKAAKARKESVAAEKEAQTPPEDGRGGNAAADAAALASIGREDRRLEHSRKMDLLKLQQQREKDQMDAEMKERDLEQKRQVAQAQRAQQAAAAALRPQGSTN